MPTSRFRRTALVCAAAITAIAGAAGSASASAKHSTTTTNCVTKTTGWGGRVCITVNATSLGNGQWQVNKISVTADRFNFVPDSSDLSIGFGLYAYNTALDEAATTDGADFYYTCPCAPKLSYTFDLSDTGYAPTSDFWTHFTGNIDATAYLFDALLYNSTNTIATAEKDLG